MDCFLITLGLGFQPSIMVEDMEILQRLASMELLLSCLFFFLFKTRVFESKRCNPSILSSSLFILVPLIGFFSPISFHITFVTYPDMPRPKSKCLGQISNFIKSIIVFQKIMPRHKRGQNNTESYFLFSIILCLDINYFAWA